MNRDDVTRMAREAGSIDSEDVIETVFAAFSAAEREACAKVCEDQADDGTEGVWDGCCLSLARHIRAREQA